MQNRSAKLADQAAILEEKAEQLKQTIKQGPQLLSKKKPQTKSDGLDAQLKAGQRSLETISEVSRLERGAAGLMLLSRPKKVRFKKTDHDAKDSDAKLKDMLAARELVNQTRESHEKSTAKVEEENKQRSLMSDIALLGTGIAVVALGLFALKRCSSSPASAANTIEAVVPHLF